VKLLLKCAKDIEILLCKIYIIPPREMNSPSSLDVDKALAEIEAPTIVATSLTVSDGKRSVCLFHNYAYLMYTYGHIVNRTYENAKWYFLTFKPFNKNYERDLHFYKNQGLEHVRKKLGTGIDCYYITREIHATKTHINVLCCTRRNLEDELHEDKTKKYFIFCEQAKYRDKTLAYILKESLDRVFIKSLDYLVRDGIKAR